MDVIDILGGILGHKTSQGGRGGDALNDIFRRGSRSSSPSGSQPTDISREAKELEDLLNVTNDRQAESAPADASPAEPSGGSPSQQQRALILIRAMVNAAKADGQIDPSEQDNIIKHLRNPSPENIQFLRDEFRRPLDVRGFAMSVPVGMEQQVYKMSLIAIDLDTGKEAKYLMELAENLRLSDEVREQIHQQLGAPNIY